MSLLLYVFFMLHCAFFKMYVENHSLRNGIIAISFFFSLMLMMTIMMTMMMMMMKFYRK